MTVRIELTTVRVARVTVLAVALALFASLLGVLCTANAHGSPVVSHVHVAGSPSGDHCDHHHEPVHEAALDRALRRPTGTPCDPGPSVDDVPVGCCVAAAVNGQPTASPDAGRVPRSGRHLLITLSVARN
ncbi:hypothetical protein SK854_13745 [Lentzea sp. BCCO 10_0061]|uniref:Secreted protein n=1 Tax=Lentzea sokolovensis TaxID=3095429 RepID=A0ABU4UUJ6_9PSEU|nr:hypothetical protein [Lentzea sp. BCCO 10_0061]MDX8143185.1 hypothetical protein [Lentzea sp. BCCO 10_0061]